MSNKKNVKTKQRSAKNHYIKLHLFLLIKVKINYTLEKSGGGTQHVWKILLSSRYFWFQFLPICLTSPYNKFLFFLCLTLLKTGIRTLCLMFCLTLCWNPPLGSGNPSALFHVIFGAGFPWASHNSVIFCPSLTVILARLSFFIVGGTKTFDK